MTNRNREVLARIRRRLARDGGVGPDVPRAAEVIAQARAQRDEDLSRALQVNQQVTSNRNLEILAEVERDLTMGGGAGPDAPAAADLIREARAERDASLNPHYRV